MISFAPVIHVVDDDALFRAAISRLLKTCGYAVVLYESADQFVENLPSQERGCILLDLQMPGLNGLDLQERLRAIDSILPIVFLTGHGDIPMSVRMIKAGAEDVLPKPVSREDLFAATERALDRYDEARAKTTRLNSEKALVATLTAREKQVFALLVRGKLHKQIAHELGTAERTVKAHRHSIMMKLKVRSLAEAVLIADRVGITGQDSSHAA
jgi:FixJ family two-component response regulator